MSCSPSNVDLLPCDFEPEEAAIVFTNQRDVLLDKLENDDRLIIAVAEKLCTNRIISKASLIDLKEAVTQKHPTSNWTELFLSKVEKTLKTEPRAFSKFIRILETESSLESVAKDLVSEYIEGMTT